MSYILQYTAEAIDDKLSLIDNKNLLPYPYQTKAISDAKPLIDYEEALVDIGDGSILTSGSTVGQEDVAIILNTCKLYAGKKYIISLDITNPGDVSTLELNSFELAITSPEEEEDYTADSSNNFTAIVDLTDKTGEFVYDVILFVPASFNTNLIIKPKIEEARISEDDNEQITPTSWIPYGETIGSYVDARFSSTDAKIKVLMNNQEASQAQTYSATLEKDNWQEANSKYTYKQDSVLKLATSHTGPYSKTVIFDLASNATLEERQAAEKACLYGNIREEAVLNGTYDYYLEIGMTAADKPEEAIPLEIVVM